MIEGQLVDVHCSPETCRAGRRWPCGSIFEIFDFEIILDLQKSCKNSTKKK
jgi:hypothetical protein